MAGALFKLSAAHIYFHTFALMIVNNGCVLAAGELEFARNCARLQVLVALEIEQRIFAMLLVELLGYVIDDHVIPILAPEPVIAIRGEDVQLVLLDPHDRDVERAAAEIEDEHRLIFVELVEAIGERGCRWLIDDLQNVEAGELSGRDRRRALSIVEIDRK